MKIIIEYDDDDGQVNSICGTGVVFLLNRSDNDEWLISLTDGVNTKFMAEVRRLQVLVVRP